MLKHMVGLAAGALATSGSAMAEERQFELLAAYLDGRLTMAIVDRNGTAVAVNLEEDTSEIIQGLAAGAILSDLRDVAANDVEADISISSGSRHSVVTVDGAVRAGRASSDEAAAVIDDLPHLTPAQRNELRSLLDLR